MVHVHQGIREDKTRINPINLTFDMQFLKTFDNFIKKLESCLVKIFGNLKKYQFIVLGDGAKFVKSTVDYFQANYVLDKFHCLREIQRVYNYYSKNRTLKSEAANLRNKRNLYYYNQIIKAIKSKDLITLINLLDKSIGDEIFSTKIKDIKRLKNYLVENWAGIKCWGNDQYSTTCLTETFVQSIIKKVKGSIGKIYSKLTILNIIKTKSFLI